MADGAGVHELERRCDPLDERQFLLAVRRLADALSYGTDASVFLGSGVDYVQSRPYEYGDPVKAIDWRVTARAGRVYVKEYQTPKQVPMYLLIDTSASMTISSRALSKYAWAVQIAGGLALAAIDRVSPVGVLGVGEHPLRLRPSLSRQQIYQWLHALRRFRVDERTTLGQRAFELAGALKSTALVVALSDLHDPEASRALKLLAQRHEVLAIQLRDPAEEGLEGVGLIRARDAESGAGLVTGGRARGWLDAALAGELKRGRVDHLVLRTDGPVAAPLAQFLRGRALLGKGAR